MRAIDIFFFHTRLPDSFVSSRPENVPEFLEAVKRKEKVLSGFGHRYVEREVDNGYADDFRAVSTRRPTLARSLCAKRRTRSSRCERQLPRCSGLVLTASSTGKDELLETAMALHQAAMKDEYFVKRRLAPNVDFWRYVQSTNLAPWLI